MTAATVPDGFLPAALGGEFIRANGPLYLKRGEGRAWLGFRVESRHTNPAGILHGGVSVLLALTRLIEREDGADAAIDFLTNQLRRRPSVRGQGALIELSLAKRPQEERDVLLVLRQLCDQLVAGAPAYRCGHCGFGARSHHWQCPSCKNWGTVKPIHGAAGE